MGITAVVDTLLLCSEEEQNALPLNLTSHYSCSVSVPLFWGHPLMSCFRVWVGFLQNVTCCEGTDAARNKFVILVMCRTKQA